MKAKYLCWVPVTLLVLIYFLIEPIVLYNFGWEKLPSITVDGPSRTTKRPEYQSAIQASEKILIEARAKLNAPAMSFAVGIDGEMVWAQAIGYKDVDTQQIADTATAFRIGSTSKAVTSVALGMLLQEKLITLDTSIQHYVPYANALRTKVTIRQLASHTSGIRNYQACLCFPVWEYYSNDFHTSLKKSADVFVNDPLLFKPGTQYSYTSYNFTLLSAAIEEISREPFLDFMSNRIFRPSGMRHTSGDFANRDIPERSSFYEVKGNMYKKVYPVDNSNKWAGGGFISTPSDLVKLGNALMTYRILREEILDTLWSVQPLSDGRPNEEGYALGWRVYPEKKIGDHTLFIAHHGGTALGATSFLVLIPKYKMTISIMMNRNSPEAFNDFSVYAFEVAKTFVEAYEASHPENSGLQP